MGGEGSGRKPDVLKMVAEQKQAVANMSAESLYLPNYSGLIDGSRKEITSLTKETIYVSNIINHPNDSTMSIDAGELLITTGSGMTNFTGGIYTDYFETVGGTDTMQIGTSIGYGVDMVLNSNTTPTIFLIRNGTEASSSTCAIAFTPEIDGTITGTSYSSIEVTNSTEVGAGGQNDIVFFTNNQTTRNEQLRLKYNGQHAIFNLPTSTSNLPSGSIWKDTVGRHRSFSNTYISGTGTAGTDNTAMDVKTIALPANTLTQVGDRMRIRTYWKGDTGANLTGTVKLNGVSVSDTTDSGGATLQLNEAWIHYIDSTHANIIENEAGALGSLSAVNASGFAWTSSQNIVFSQNAAASNHAILYALIIDIFPIANENELRIV